MIDHRINGYVAEYKNAADLAKGLEWVLYETEAKEMAQQARHKVLSRYDDVRHVLEDVSFRTLTEGPGAPIFGRSMLQWEGVEHNKKSGPVVKRMRPVFAS